MNTALDPALHMHSVNHVNFKDGFSAVDESKRPLKTGASTTARCAHVLIRKFSATVCKLQNAMVYQVDTLVSPSMGIFKFTFV